MDKKLLPKDFQKNITYNALQLIVKARNDLLYAHQIIGETYAMRENYELPLTTHNAFYHAKNKCAAEAIPAINDIVANIASAYIECCEAEKKKENEDV